MTNTASGTALQNPVFRKRWIASLFSESRVAAHDTAANWINEYAHPVAGYIADVDSGFAAFLSVHAPWPRGP
jgi:hypothetical protein